jgi:RNA polymerase sigma-B factor
VQTTEATKTPPKTVTVAQGSDLLPVMPSPAPMKNLSDAYNQWAVDRKPEHLHATVEFLKPTIDYKLAAMGVGDNPQMRHQARLMVASAVEKFNPNVGVSLTTWAQQHLQGMNRFKRENQGPVKVPDRAALDAWSIEKAQQELEDKLGREPDVHELADFTNISVKRIASVRKATRPVAASSQMYSEGEDFTDYLGEAMSYVYDDSDADDRKIIELTTGYGGNQPIPKNQIATRLGISPAQVTRRTERIANKLQAMELDLKETF